MRSLPSLAIAIIVLVSAPLRAQVVEVGGTVAAGCLGSDGSACGTGTHPMFGVHASWLVTERFEIVGRAAHVGLPDAQLSAAFPVPLRLEVTDRARDFISAQVVYRFRRGKRIRPFLGFGSGGYRHTQTIRCDPDCGFSPGTLPGRKNSWMSDVIVTTGLSGDIGGRWSVRGGVITHRFANDENSTVETFAGVGYRFGAK